MLRSLRRWIMGPQRDIIVIVGTTGVGKSQFSIEIAKRFNGEVINADSMQMYKGADIITNKHPEAERYGVPHHVMNHTGWDEEYFIHRFDKEAKAAINDIHSRGKVPIIVGGTHYYLNSLLFNNKTIKNKNGETSEQITDAQQKILDSSPELVYQCLKEHDPVVAEKFHPNDTRRIRRALEIYFVTKQRASEHYSTQVRASAGQSSLRFRTLVFWLFAQKPTLDKRLDERVDNMLSNGGIEEIKELYQFYCGLNPAPDCERGIWQVIGFKEFLPWLQSGNEADFEESVEDMKKRTRQYAKKQVKWIQNLLAEDLAKESKHNHVNGGKLYILDATDLNEWHRSVSERGTAITEKFLKEEFCNIGQAPNEELKYLLPHLAEEEENFESKTTKWKHFSCNNCLDKSGTPFVAVGEEQWKIHTKSKRHRSNLNRGKRKREYEEWLSKQQQNSTESTT